MDNHQLPQRSNNNDGFNHSLFSDNQQQQYRPPNFDNYYPQQQHGEQSVGDASWNNFSNQPNPSQSRAMPMHSVNWAQNPTQPTHAQHTASHASINGQSHPYPRPLSQSPAPFTQNAYAAFGNQPGYHYNQQQYDPALFNTPTPDHTFNQAYPSYGNAPGTIAPGALNQGPPRHDATPTGQAELLPHRQSAASTPQQSVVNYSALMAAIPKSAESGNVLIVEEDQLATATNSRRMAAYLHVGNEAYEWPMNRGTTLPPYVPRKSRNDLKKLAGDDVVLLAKINKGAAKKQRVVSTVKPSGAKSVGSPAEAIKYERDTSSGEDSSDDDSYTSDEDLENPPLPNKRPEGLKDGVEYDTVKALWRSKRRSIDGKSIRTALTDFWEIVKVIRDRWKADLNAVAEAEKKQKVGDLAVLKSRVKDQRDMIEVAFKAAQKHGHRSIVELLGENLSLVFLCYQFLLDRFKADDLNGSLARSILEVISLCTTLTQAGLDKTHLDQVLQRYVKKADAKTAFYAKRILSNAATATKEAPPAQPDAKPKVNGIAAKSAEITTGTKAAPVSAAGVKRAAGQAADTTATKKAAVGASKPNGASPVSKVGTLKRPVTAAETTKTPTTTTVKPKPAAKSSFFASLQSAAKKPGTSIKSGTAVAPAVKSGEKKPTAANAAPKSTFSFAETMANLTKPKEEKKEVLPEKQLPSETEAEKALRLRKEARRKLHVKFKPPGELEEIRYFEHSAEEESGHNSSQMLDMGDVGGEGRMLKLHKDMMDLDEDDSDEETVLVDFREPTDVDFSVVDSEERQRNFEHRGGLAKVASAEREVREKYESSTLIVFYTDSNDIPPNPREPADPFNGDQGQTTVAFGAPDEKLAARARQRKPPQSAPQQPPPFNLDALFKTHQQAIPTPQPQAPMPNSQALSDILAQLSGQPPQQPHQQPPMQMAAPFMGFGTSVPPSAPPPQPAQTVVPDIGAILAQLQQQGQFAGQQAPQQQPSYYENNDRKRTWEGEAGDEPASKKRPVPPPTVSSYRYKTRTCTYWRDGRCNKGDMCTFAHEELPD